mmetsp:Transcript_110426/g.263220  ORF Transcript_110426/g.263220 Transcript_110426/m.263220 type:complete len:221 (+) Transcript_110426:738-1400(+)
MKNILCAAECVHHFSCQERILEGHPREQYPHATGEGLMRIGWQSLAQDLFHSRKHLERVVGARRLLPKDHLEDVRRLKPRAQHCGHQRAARGAAEAQVLRVRVRASRLRGHVVRYDVLPKPRCHTEMIAVHPTARVECYANLPRLLQSGLTLTFFLIVKVGVEHQPIHHTQKINQQNGSRDLHIPEIVDTKQRMARANGELEHLEFSDVCLLHQRNSALC